MVEKGKYKVRYLMESGILYNNSEICVLNCEGKTIFIGMAWEMDDDILGLDLKHILSVFPTDRESVGRVWIEVYDKEPKVRPYMCEQFNSLDCDGCKLKDMARWKQRRKSSHGGFCHEQVGVQFGAIEWSPVTPDDVKETIRFDKCPVA